MNFSIVWIILFLKTSHSDIVFNDTESTDRNFKNPIKLWYGYIKIFVFTKIITEKNNYFYLTHVPFQGFHRSKVFLSQMKRYVISSKHIINKRTPRKYKTSLFNMEDLSVTWVTGQIYLYHTSPLKSKTYIFKFTVHVVLTLNITFLIIDFLVQDCDNTKLVVTKTPNVKLSKWSDVLHVHIHDEEYTYCKYYSAFSLYPKFNNLYILYDISINLLPIELRAIFSVIDHKFITTLPTKGARANQISRRDFSNINTFHNYNINKYYFLMSYLIQMMKHCQIVLSSHFADKKIAIYDGPGFTFHLLHSNGIFYLTSSFQCIIQVLQEIFYAHFNKSQIFILCKGNQDDKTYRNCRWSYTF